MFIPQILDEIGNRRPATACTQAESLGNGRRDIRRISGCRQGNEAHPIRECIPQIGRYFQC